MQTVCGEKHLSDPPNRYGDEREYLLEALTTTSTYRSRQAERGHGFEHSFLLRQTAGARSDCNAEQVTNMVSEQQQMSILSRSCSKRESVGILDLIYLVMNDIYSGGLRLVGELQRCSALCRTLAFRSMRRYTSSVERHEITGAYGRSDV